MPKLFSQSVPTLNSVAVVSSAIAQIAYDSERETLQVEFCDGRVYRYEGVPSLLYQALLQADSKGAYFNRHIRKQLCCRIAQGCTLKY